MDQEEFYVRMARVSAALEPLPERESAVPVAEEPVVEWRPWQTRHVERPRPGTPPETVRRRAPDAMIARQLEAHAREFAELRAQVARHETNFGNVRNCLEALADEAGATIGELRKQVNELQAKIEAQEARINDQAGEIALLRALQPQKLLRARGTPPTTIEGSLGGRPSVQ
jgi:chromosome segregation ATPase